MSLLSTDVLQRQIVRHSKEPPLEVRSQSVLLQVPEQRQEDVLNQVFAVADSDTGRAPVPKQRISEFVEEGEDLVFDP